MTFNKYLASIYGIVNKYYKEYGGFVELGELEVIAETALYTALLRDTERRLRPLASPTRHELPRNRTRVPRKPKTAPIEAYCKRWVIGALNRFIKSERRRKNTTEYDEKLTILQPKDEHETKYQELLNDYLNIWLNVKNDSKE